MDWTVIIKKEYECLKIERKKRTIDIWNQNKALIHSQQTEVLLYANWNAGNDRCFALDEVNAFQVISNGIGQKMHFTFDVFSLPSEAVPPSMTMWTPIRRNFVTKDSESLLCQDDDNNDDMPSVEVGPIDDEMFVSLVRKLMLHQHQLMSHSCNSIAHEVEERFPDDIIFQSISSYFKGNYTVDKYIKLTKCKSKQVPNIDDQLAAPLQPSESLRSYRKYFCRRCCIYSCGLHSHIEDSEGNNFVGKKKVVEFNAFTEACSSTCYLKEKIGSIEKMGNTLYLNNEKPLIPNSERTNADVFANDLIEMSRSSADDICTEESQPRSSNDSTEKSQSPEASVLETMVINAHDATNSTNEWSFSDQTLFVALLNVFPYNCCAIAKTMRKSCEQVYRKMQLTDPPIRIGATDKPREKQQTLKCTCTMGACSTAGCVCYNYQRECDPELCECRSCKNMCIQLGHEKKIVVVSSLIHGWGVVISEICEINDFIGEYTGEVISNKECNRRAKRSSTCTYMFTLNGDTVVDAAFYGSKLRFLNYSKEPNCYCRVMMVNGDHRIGVYAARYIAVGEELTIDYFTHDPTAAKK